MKIRRTVRKTEMVDVEVLGIIPLKLSDRRRHGMPCNCGVCGKPIDGNDAKGIMLAVQPNILSHNECAPTMVAP